MFKNVRKTYHFKCSTCHEAFASTRPDRSFCSVKCRAQHPSFRAVLLENLAKPKARNGPKRRGKSEPCVECGKPVYSKPARKRRFCGRACYHAWNAKRFDRNVGAIDSVGKLSGYDEFLSQPQLHCLHRGCTWVGNSLSHHMNLVHGITAEALKERAGFNRGTGVVSDTLVRILEARPHIERSPPQALAVAARAGHQPELRREGHEHVLKAYLARRAMDEEG